VDLGAEGLVALFAVSPGVYRAGLANRLAIDLISSRHHHIMVRDVAWLVGGVLEVFAAEVVLLQSRTMTVQVCCLLEVDLIVVKVLGLKVWISFVPVGGESIWYQVVTT
jgi:hypothetical protein